MSDVFHLEITRCGRREQMRVAAILKRHGWIASRSTGARRWRKPEDRQQGLW